MSNLGLYQWLPTISKKVGGVPNFLCLVAASGAVIYKLGEKAVEYSAPKIKEAVINKNTKERFRTCECNSVSDLQSDFIM